MVKITIKNNRFFEKSMKKFSRKIDKEGILKEVRERMHFVKPSVKAFARKNYLQAMEDKRDAGRGGK